MPPAFPHQNRTPVSLLRSWRREEQWDRQRRRNGPGGRGGSVRAPAIALLLLTPLLLIDLSHRATTIRAGIEQTRDDTLAIMEAALSVTKRAAKDWGYWEDAYRYMRGENPGYPVNNLGTAALFDGGAVMVLLNRDGQPRLTFAAPAFRRPSYRGLIRCLQSNLSRLPSVRSTVRLACLNEDGSLYLGAATSISNNDASAPAAGTIAMFDPLLKPEYTPRIRQRMLTLRQELVLLPQGAAGPQVIEPPIHGEGQRLLGLRQPPLLALLGRSLLEDLPLLLGLAAVAAALRGVVMLDRRRQRLRDVLVERRANQRFRQACQDLEELVEVLGDDRPTPRCSIDAGPLPDSSQPAIERRLIRLTRRLHELLERTRSLALQDPLTGLPNRRHFIEILEERAGRAGPAEVAMAILFVDVDRFKTINDRYGHAAGDAVLRVLAQRLGQVLRPGDVLARFGGDELAVLLDLSALADRSPAQLEEQAARMAARLGETVQQPIQAGERSLEVGLSIGWGLMTPTDPDIAAALRRADEAMYAVKRGRPTADTD